jgi:hypothetical protein
MWLLEKRRPQTIGLCSCRLHLFFALLVVLPPQFGG